MSSLILSRIGSRPLDICSLLTLFRRTQCADPRDKVYAIRGLACDLRKTDLVPGYKKSIEAVYTDVVAFALRSSEIGLDILGYVGRPAQGAKNRHLLEIPSPALPSWVPDWRQRVYLSPFAKILTHLEIPQQSIYNAAANTKLDANINDNLLSVQGFCIDFVSQTACTWDTAPGNRGFVEQWEGLLTPGMYGNWKSSKNAFKRTLIGNFGWGLLRGEQWSVEILPSHRGDLTTEQKREADEIDNYIQQVCWPRRFGLTHKGFMGIFPAATAIGDKIAIFHRGRVLYAIRPVSYGYEFIGECYVHGFMNGEVFLSSFSEHEYPETLILV